jgi:hypothetical protein
MSASRSLYGKRRYSPSILTWISIDVLRLEGLDLWSIQLFLKAVFSGFLKVVFRRKWTTAPLTRASYDFEARVHAGNREVSRADAERDGAWYVAGIVDDITAASEDTVVASGAIGDWDVVSGMVPAS